MDLTIRVEGSITYKWAPNLVINGDRTPISRVRTPVTRLFWAIDRVYNPICNW